MVILPTIVNDDEVRHLVFGCRSGELAGVVGCLTSQQREPVVAIVSRDGLFLLLLRTRDSSDDCPLRNIRLILIFLFCCLVFVLLPTDRILRPSREYIRSD